jgi:uncharacterized protein (UPF0332 family)
MKMATKFPSLTGISLSNATEGQKVQISLISNCEDKTTIDKNVVCQNILDDIVYPEIIDRARNGQLLDNFRLSMAHIIMHIDETKNEVLLNEDVLFFGQVTLKDQGKMNINDGELLPVDNISEVHYLYACPNSPPNAAHILLLKINQRWYISYNFTYNKKLVRQKVNNSLQFFDTSKDIIEKNRWGPVVDNLYSSVELCIQSLLLMTHQGKYSSRQTHQSTEELFRIYADNGNIDKKFLELYHKLKNLRKKGRYLEGLHGKEFMPGEEQIKNYIILTNELIEYTKFLMNSWHNIPLHNDKDIITFGACPNPFKTSTTTIKA